MQQDGWEITVCLRAEIICFKNQEMGNIFHLKLRKCSAPFAKALWQKE